MKTGRIAAAIGMVVGGVLAVQPVLAQLAPFPTAARRYAAWMARAMDECSSPTTSVVSPGVPASGCIQANVTTDSAIGMKLARLNISKVTGKVTLFGTGFQFGNRVSTQLTLRVTKQDQTTTSPAGINPVTFQDVTITCPNIPNAPFWFVARQTGALAGSVKLTDCLTQAGLATGLASGNVEVLDAALINVDTNKVFARPGIVR